MLSTVQLVSRACLKPMPDVLPPAALGGFLGGGRFLADVCRTGSGSGHAGQRGLPRDYHKRRGEGRPAAGSF